jgi:D-sedoheptulose 7-phosphate isomerase
MKSVKQALSTAAYLVQQVAESAETEEFIREMAQLITETFAAGRKVLVCGNGGSAADAMHFAEEFTGRFRKERKALPVIALCDPTHITCVGNDYGFAEIFAKGVQAFGKDGDVFLGISTSGNSLNIIKAWEEAGNLGMKTILFLGNDGGKLSGPADLQIIVPGETTDRIQELHMMILHIVIEQVERLMFPENYR